MTLAHFDKQDIVRKSIDYWNPHKTRFWRDWGIDLVIGKREGYYLYDTDGRRLLDCHINGGTYSLGHRNPELMDALQESLRSEDVGNHHFPTPGRALLAEKLARLTPGDLQYSVYTTSGSEAVDVAIKSAHHLTGKKRIVSVEHAFHGHTGYALAVGDQRFLDLFNAHSENFVQVPFNDTEALERELKKGDVAAFIVETIPATFGFIMPEPGYLKEVRRLTEKYGVLYIADEVQTGLLRSGRMWGVETYGVAPDMLITGKGFGGGLYPIAATVIAKQHAGWLENDGFGHVSTYGGSEIGCHVASRVLDICERPEVQSGVRYIAEYLRTGLNELMSEYSDVFIGVRQNGLIMGLEFNHPLGALHLMKELYKNGVWAIFSSFDESVLQFKPGVLWDKELCDEFLDRLADSLTTVCPKLRKDKDLGRRRNS